ncbi:MAG: S1 RNA-binding domain-containing protein, partial [Clostridia bacterium]|nr:S1 RNA-binding domain-containing protein [Clostridia bacterium]
PGMELTGTVRNVIDFGAFVDIGVHQDGLVHISRMADRFIRHPSEVVKVGDVVKVWVVSVDEKKKRIALTMVKEKL